MLHMIAPAHSLITGDYTINVYVSLEKILEFLGT